MLELLSSGLVAAWLSTAGLPDPLNTLTALLGQDAPWLVLTSTPDAFTQTTLQQYLKQLARTGLSEATQGVWLQSGSLLLASNQGTTPLPAASLTKVATSLVALHNWGPYHEFETEISRTGEIQDGVLQGDLVIRGNGDPLFVWEEAIALGNRLNQMGISRVAGNLIIQGNFTMGFEAQPDRAGEMLKQALNADAWTETVEYPYNLMPAGTPRPRVTIAGSVRAIPASAVPAAEAKILVRHRSLPLAQILKLMNLYSNNAIAESLATTLGGAPIVAQRAAQIAVVPQQEILLSNGSGLGMENRISPRATCALFAAIQRTVQPYGLSIADLFPVAGVDQGTIEGRQIPAATVVKTGTLNEVSALAGVLPTRDQGLIWFAMINRGSNLDGLRQQQDRLLQSLIAHWGTPIALPTAVLPGANAELAATGNHASDRSKMVHLAVDVNTW